MNDNDSAMNVRFEIYFFNTSKCFFYANISKLELAFLEFEMVKNGAHYNQHIND